MASRSKVLGNRPIRREKSLRMPRRLKALHAPLALTGELVGVFRTVIQIAVLAVLDPR